MNSVTATAMGLLGDFFLDFSCVHFFVADHFH